MLIGVVGKPNVGKSTFFKAVTLAEVEIANYPFATIKPNSGVGYVKIEDVAKERNQTANPRDGYVLEGFRFVPVQLIDVAGLVPGAYEGKGMGNQFLDDLRQADILVHVIDVSGSVNEKGEPVNPGEYDPAEDVRFLAEELDQWILRLVTKGWDRFARSSQQINQDPYKALAHHLTGLGVDEDGMKAIVGEAGLESKPLTDYREDDLLRLAQHIRKKTKPMVIAANKVDVKGAEQNLKRLQKDFPDEIIVPCSAESELALREAAKHKLIDYVPGGKDFISREGAGLSGKQQDALQFIKETILKEYGATGVQQVLDKAVFDVLRYIAIHPGGVGSLADKHGNVLPDCFLMPQGTTALEFAYRLHTDFGRNFIKALDCKTKMAVGKDHKLKHLDIIEIAANA